MGLQRCLGADRQQAHIIRLGFMPVPGQSGARGSSTSSRHRRCWQLPAADGAATHPFGGAELGAAHHRAACVEAVQVHLLACSSTHRARALAHRARHTPPAGVASVVSGKSGMLCDTGRPGFRGALKLAAPSTRTQPCACSLSTLPQPGQQRRARGALQHPPSGLSEKKSTASPLRGLTAVPRAAHSVYGGAACFAASSQRP